MECMAARALKSSFLTETSTKPTTTQQVFTDDIWCVAGFTGGSGTDDFSIDEFFDIPNEDSLKNASFTVEDEEEEEEKYSSSSLSHHLVDDSHNFSSQLSIPADDLQELELWSHLMDDSLPQEAIFACPTPIQPKQTGFELVNRVGTGRKRSVSRVVPFIPTAVPVKPRTKRPRISSNRVWFTGSPSSSSSSASSSLPSSPVSTLVFPNLVQETRLIFSFGKPAVKKPKRKPVVVSGETGGSVVQRRCTHCQVTKTPQWRTGPNGPKSLCNACGVRFKSGRLFPEYRPACSPTFSSEVHSNSHRKVLEMRRKKEAVGSETGSDPISS